MPSCTASSIGSSGRSRSSDGYCRDVTAAGAELTLRHPVERFALDNGLRVVLAPDRSVPVVAVSVFYDVGMRNEPEGRTGFAHLFEHLMFQGSAHVPKLEHARLVQAAGGKIGRAHV